MTNDGTREAVLDAAMALISRPSENPPGEEGAVADWLTSRLNASPVPFDIERTTVEPNRSNVIAHVGDPTHGSVLLTGHMDVVPADGDEWTINPYDPTIRDGRLVGRGAADMKGALAAMMVAAEQYYEHTDNPGEVILGFVVDEEHAGRGTQTLVDTGLTADAAIVGEPTDMNVCTAIKGVSRYEATVHGESCHSGQPDEGKDAIIGLRSLLHRITALDDELATTTAHPVLTPEDITVTEVSGGIAPNVVADQAEATLDWRFLPGTTDPGPFDDRIDDALDDLTVDGTTFGVSVDRTVFARAAEIDSDQPVSTAVLDATRSVGLDADIVGFNAATDARFLIHDANVPTVHFGPGSLTRDAHTVDESVAIDDLVATVSVYWTVLEQLL
jgi:succinyl-diaminopimelate desuccinylase